jgi:3-deoxy-manno-octulosonate cytidylyltransferase (CMP-KDO synthetase)
VFRVVIPARFDSVRLPGKVLLPLAGKPMLQWVYERARAASAEEVLIATDDARVATAARGFGAEVVMTASTHPSGTDRIAQVAADRLWRDVDIVVNVQADEPLIPPALIDQVARILESHPQAHIATLATPINSQREFLDPNVVKVVMDLNGSALYFSRAAVPFRRDPILTPGANPSAGPAALRHIGIYAYRVDALKRLTALAPSFLESCEKLEQLRALENALQIQVARSCEMPGPDVNSAADLARVADLMSNR